MIIRGLFKCMQTIHLNWTIFQIVYALYSPYNEMILLNPSMHQVHCHWILPHNLKCIRTKCWMMFLVVYDQNYFVIWNFFVLFSANLLFFFLPFMYIYILEFKCSAISWTSVCMCVWNSIRSLKPFEWSPMQSNHELRKKNHHSMNKNPDKKNAKCDSNNDQHLCKFIGQIKFYVQVSERYFI